MYPNTCGQVKGACHVAAACCCCGFPRHMEPCCLRASRAGVCDDGRPGAAHAQYGIQVAHGAAVLEGYGRQAAGEALAGFGLPRAGHDLQSEQADGMAVGS